jgi:YfiH family protein
MTPGLVLPDWPAPARVRAAQTTRSGGFSSGRYAGFNLGARCGDEPEAVERNRALLRRHLDLPAEPGWLNQIHGMAVVRLPQTQEPAADASWTRGAGQVCTVLTADCLPVLFCDEEASVVAAAHAGWRGLAGGVLEQTVQALPVPSQRLMAWLGAAIGPTAFEVGAEVREVFVQQLPEAAACFVAGRPGKYFADLYALARLRLRSVGIDRVYGGGACTYSDASQWYSFRRDAVCGRMASLIWLV